LKYIQCPHCDKKYTASEKLCAAAGKNIRCKHCRQIFKIVIHDDNIVVEQEDLPLAAEHTAATIEPAADDAASPGEQADQKALPESNDEPEKSTKPVKKKFNIQLLISIILAFALLAVVTVAYLFFYQHELFEPSKAQDKKHIIPGALIKPVNITFPQQQPATTPEKSKPKAVLPLPHSKKATTSPEGRTIYSQHCKDSSADYWVRTRRLATGQLDTATYLELLNQNVNQADEIRRLCKDKLLITRITESAKTGRIPAWMKTEIQSRNISK